MLRRLDCLAARRLATSAPRNTIRRAILPLIQARLPPPLLRPPCYAHARGYATPPPPGGGQGGGFNMFGQQQQKGEALKEYVRHLVSDHKGGVLMLEEERRLDRACEEREIGSDNWAR